MDTILGIDAGTSGLKAVLVGRDGRTLAAGEGRYPLHTDGPRAEQTPGDWWAALCAATAAVWQSAPPGAAASVAAVALSGQMQDLILVGDAGANPEGDGGAIGPAILYMDCRAQDEADEAARTLGAAELARRTGNLQGAGSLLAKWLWLARHAPERLAAARHVLLGAHSYLAWRLTGAAAADYTTAATTGLLDLAAAGWVEDWLERLGLDAALLPRLLPASAVCGCLSAAAGAALGLPAGLPVVHGAGDLGATTVGVGAGAPGRAYLYLGTSGWVAASLAHATPNPEGGLFTLRHPDPTAYIQVAPMLTAGGNLAWARAQVAGGLDYAGLDAAAASAPPGSRGVLYLPYLAGERSPFTDPHARAGFLGLSAAATTGDLVRAVMEGTAFAYRSLAETVGVEPGSALYLAGGGGRSALWPQIIADVLGGPVHVAAQPEDAGARGAAVIAGVGLGWWPDFTPAGAFFPSAAVYAPDPARAERYGALYAVFRGLYPALAASFAALASIVED